MEDEEILYAYGKEGSVVKAAARCCEILAAKYAKKDGFRGGTIQSEKTSISGKYRMQAKLLRARGITANSFVMPALSITTKDESVANTDIPQPHFSRKQFNHPEAENVDPDSESDARIVGGT
jgi:hypothetical protein